MPFMIPNYQFTRARDLAPHYFKQLERIGGISSAHSLRTQAALEFARRKAEQERLEAQRKAFEDQIKELKQVRASRASSGGAAIGAILGAPASARGNIRLGKEAAARRGWTGREWDALYTLGMRESGWRNTAQNPRSTAYGIGQFLNKTWATVGGRKTSDPALQIEYMLRYIAQRYGSPSAALSFWNRNHWY